MFNSGNSTKEIPVLLRFADGRAVQGKLIIGATSDLPRTLNGDGIFVEFEAYGEGRSYVAKSAIGEVVPSEIPKVKKLDAGADSDEDFDPHRILKVAPQSDAQTVRNAYVARAKMYHPDRFSNVELPPEMAKYAENMARLVNAAFQMINADRASGLNEAQHQNAQAAPADTAVHK